MFYLTNLKTEKKMPIAWRSYEIAKEAGETIIGTLGVDFEITPK